MDGLWSGQLGSGAVWSETECLLEYCFGNELDQENFQQSRYESEGVAYKDRIMMQNLCWRRAIGVGS